MRNASEKALEVATSSLLLALSESEDNPLEVGQELFTVGTLLESESSLRRALNDSSRLVDDKSILIRKILGNRVSEATLAAVTALSGQRLSNTRDIVKCLDLLGSRAIIESARQNNQLTVLIAELGQLRNVIKQERQLRILLSHASELDDFQRHELIDSLFAQKLSKPTLDLFHRLVAKPRGASLLMDLDMLAVDASEAEKRKLARVTSAHALTDAQKQRLQSILEKKYGPITMNLAIDPSVVGGLRVRVANESIDGTLKTELSQARRRLVG
ncbi:F0F1 ATP synthase subunit delta [Actinomycetaceae bacterium TAE3-ERU4]|nr:F0F1 ATP synthase subunit delta [Actinomycetaceae bacterium TAE3-ERU4]